jgi:hypothetical protein
MVLPVALAPLEAQAAVVDQELSESTESLRTAELAAAVELVAGAATVAQAVAVLADLPMACWRLASPNCSSIRRAFAAAAVVQALMGVQVAEWVALVAMAATERVESPVRRASPTLVRRAMVRLVARRTDGLTTLEPIRRSATHRSERVKQALAATARPRATTARLSRQTCDLSSQSTAGSVPRSSGDNIVKLASVAQPG